MVITKKMLPRMKDDVIRKEFEEKMAGLKPYLERMSSKDGMKNLHDYIIEAGKRGFTGLKLKNQS